MDMLRVTILEGGIDDTFWPEIILVMTYIKNLQPIWALESNISPIVMQNQTIPDIQHLCLLGSNVYIFLHDSHTIYRINIEDQNKVIQVKDLRIFKDITSKSITSLLNFNEKPTFDRVQMSDEQSSDKNIISKEKKVIKRLPKKPSKARVGRDVNRASKEENKPKTIM